MSPRLNKTRSTLQSGYTLIELLLAMSLGVILTAGLLQVFQGSKKSYNFSSELSRMQENARYALDLISHDIRMIGYQGCADPNDIVPNVIANPPPAGLTSVAGLKAYNVSSLGVIQPSALPTSYTTASTLKNYLNQSFNVSSYVLPNTDIIMMQYMNPLNANVTNSQNNSTAQVQLTSNPNNFVTGSYVMISDCQSVDVFRPNTVSSSGGKINMSFTTGNDCPGSVNCNTANRLSKAYPDGAMVLRFETNMYFVAPSGKDKDTGATRTDTRGDAINSLYKADVDNHVYELVQGVDAMVMLYGEEVTGGNIRYYRADQSPDLSKVKSIKVGLLMSSIEGITDEKDTATYNVAGTNFGPTGSPSYNSNDHRLRRVFTTTVNLRNRK